MSHDDLKFIHYLIIHHCSEALLILQALKLNVYMYLCNYNIIIAIIYNT